MDLRLLDILECPFCGQPLRLQPAPPPILRDDRLLSGILGCPCCAYPVVDGIPYLRTGEAADRAMTLLGQGNAAEALLMMLELDDPDRRRRFERLLQDEARHTFRAALEVLSRDAEGDYLLYRFSDPTFVASDGVLRMLGPTAGRALDLCGGAGHLTRTLCDLSASPGGGGVGVVVADIAYWKLWLAKQFVAPAAHAVCCDAGQPLPFASAAFSLVCCSDAFHYVWPRRLLAGEMMRAAGTGGTIVLPHLHNAACVNPSAGMPLSADGYRHLFRERLPRLFAERAVLDAALAGTAIDLGVDARGEGLAGEPNLILIAANHEVPRSYVPTRALNPNGLTVNPLYQPARADDAQDGRIFELRFPSDFYEQEFAACLRYLPRRVEIPARAFDQWAAGGTDALREQFTRQRVLIDLPARYL